MAHAAHDADLQSWLPLGTAERRFLLAAVQAEPQPLAAPPAPFDWHAFSRRARADGLAAILYWRLRDAPYLVPGDIFADLRARYYQDVATNHLRFAELGRLGRLLATRDIPLLALKGAALAHALYPDPGLRFMGDLDLAAPPEQTAAALSLLESDGYTVVDGDQVGPGLLFHAGWHVRLRRALHGHDFEVELHWPRRRHVLVAQVARLDVPALWATAVPLDDYVNIYQLAPPETLLHLALHTGLQHRFADLGLRPYLDIDRLVRRHGARPAFWRRLVELAGAARAGHVTFHCLALAQTLLATPLPADALAELAPGAGQRRRFARRLSPSRVVNRERVFYNRGRRDWRRVTTDRFWHRLAGPARQLFPGRAYLATYYDQPAGRPLAILMLRHPFHATARALRRRWREAGPVRPTRAGGGEAVARVGPGES